MPKGSSSDKDLKEQDNSALKREDISTDHRFMSIHQLSDITGKHRQTISKALAEMERIDISGGKYYRTKDALFKIFELNDNRKNSLDLQEQRAKLAQVQTEKQIIEVKKMKGELLPIADMIAAVEKEYTYVRGSLLALPSKMAQRLSIISDPEKIDEELHHGVNDLLNALVHDEKLAKIEKEDEASEHSA